jgi:hypothetical protein
MKELKFLWIFLLCISSVTSFSQTENDSYDCMDKLGKSFISDGQDHRLVIRNNKPTQLNIFFYPKFKYRLVACCANSKIPIELKLRDENGNVYFTNVNKNYIRVWDFRFTSITSGIIEVRLANTGVKEESLRLIIGSQPIDK